MSKVIVIARSPISPTVFRRPAGPLTGFDRIVVSPDDQRLSLPVWWTGRQLLVSAPELIGCFDSPRRDNVLFLRDPPAHPWVVLTAAGQTPLWYRRMAAVEIEEEFGASLAAQQGPLARCLYRQADEGPPLHGEVPLEAVNEVPIRPADGCLNPLILCLSVGGAELALAPLREEIGEPLCCEAVAGPVADLHYVFAQRVKKAVARRGGPLSPVETVLIGLDMRAALALDALDGTFVVEGPDGAPARYGWVPPRRMSANAAWLADYWLACWGGRKAQVRAVRPLPKSPKPAVGRNSAGEWFAEVDGAELDGLMSSAHACLARLRPQAVGPAMRAAMQLLAHRAATFSGAILCHRAALRVHPADGGRFRLSLCPSTLLDGLAAHLLPRSQVRLCLPADAPLIVREADRPALAQAHAEACCPRFVDLLDAMPLQRLFAALEGQPLPAEPRQVPYRFGWRDDWLGLLFASARGTRLSLTVSGGGFVLGRSRLGSGRLGGCSRTAFALTSTNFQGDDVR
ncbi:MAG TPA: hypothetical protein VMG10_11660 [Gemmataceae bacterium]|nr:hypothetical protein [Gemmataceae bacterium]